MSKLKVVIADQDADYVQSLGRSLADICGDSFLVSCFTEEQALLGFLHEGRASEEKTADFLLLGGRFIEYAAECRHICGGQVVHLTERNSDGSKSQKKQQKNKIFKYQRADFLARQLLQLKGGGSSREHIVRPNAGRPSIVAVFSANGGAGKTTVAAGLCIQTVWTGKSAFYLNLEFMPSTGLFFSGEQEQNLSHVLYALKTGKKDTAFCCETAISVDSWSGVHFYKAPDSLLDLKEDVAEELRRLIRALAETGRYDRICIDLSSNLDNNCLTVLELCDEIMLVSSEEAVALEKMKALLAEFARLEQGKGLSFTGKTVLLLNKYEHAYEHYDEKQAEGQRIGGQPVVAVIPRVAGLLIPHGPKYRLDMNSPFGAAIGELAARY